MAERVLLFCPKRLFSRQNRACEKVRASRADYVIDLGPEGGDGGGQIIAKGTPEAIAAQTASSTGRFLRKVLGGIPGGRLCPPGKTR
jgi:hypothetical protein